MSEKRTCIWCMPNDMPMILCDDDFIVIIIAAWCEMSNFMNFVQIIIDSVDRIYDSFNSAEISNLIRLWFRAVFICFIRMVFQIDTLKWTYREHMYFGICDRLSKHIRSLSLPLSFQFSLAPLFPSRTLSSFLRYTHTHSHTQSHSRTSTLTHTYRCAQIHARVRTHTLALRSLFERNLQMTVPPFCFKHTPYTCIHANVLVIVSVVFVSRSYCHRLCCANSIHNTRLWRYDD